MPIGMGSGSALGLGRVPETDVSPLFGWLLKVLPTFLRDSCHEATKPAAANIIAVTAKDAARPSLEIMMPSSIH